MESSGDITLKELQNLIENIDEANVEIAKDKDIDMSIEKPNKKPRLR